MAGTFKIVVVDGQGGKLGAQLVTRLTEVFAEHEVTAIGTNTIATSSMLKAGAKNAATGENAVIVACRTADIIVGPIGIVIADSLLGEITPKMAVAVGQSLAKKILIPINRCDNIVIGAGNMPMADLIDKAIAEIEKIIHGN